MILVAPQRASSGFSKPCNKSTRLPSLAMNIAGHRNHGPAEAFLLGLCESPSIINSESPPESPSWPPLVTQRLAMVTVASQIMQFPGIGRMCDYVAHFENDRFHSTSSMQGLLLQGAMTARTADVVSPGHNTSCADPCRR